VKRFWINSALFCCPIMVTRNWLAHMSQYLTAICWQPMIARAIGIANVSVNMISNFIVFRLQSLRCPLKQFYYLLVRVFYGPCYFPLQPSLRVRTGGYPGWGHHCKFWLHQPGLSSIKGKLIKPGADPGQLSILSKTRKEQFWGRKWIEGSCFGEVPEDKLVSVVHHFECFAPFCLEHTDSCREKSALVPFLPVAKIITGWSFGTPSHGRNEHLFTWENYAIFQPLNPDLPRSRKGLQARRVYLGWRVISCTAGLVSKETVALHRWGRETQKRDKKKGNFVVRSVLKSDDQPGTFKCVRERCNTCTFIHNADKITGPKRSIKITDRFTCTSANVIYCITCTLCKTIYIGEKTREETRRPFPRTPTRRWKKWQGRIQTSRPTFQSP